MSTTELSAELLITGTGVVLWMAFLIAAIFKLSIQDIVTKTNVFTLAPILGLAYVLGIIIDRLGYSLYSRAEGRILKRIVKQNSTYPLSDQEKFILLKSEELSRQLTYNRSRLRVSRSWSINFFMIAIASGIWSYTSCMSYPFFLPLLSLILTIACLLTWQKLVKDYYTSVQATYAFLIKQEMKKSTLVKQDTQE
jgi:hypothetical protein